MPPTAATTEIIPAEGFQLIPISALVPSKFNPRKSFDKGKLDELASSIKSKGLIEPLVVRPAGPFMFEIVAGERRFRASRIAGLDRVKAEVRELSDEDVLELQVIENLQREDVQPLDEAEGYRALMTMNPEKHTPEHVAAAVGKSVSYIYQRLKLLALIGKAQKMFRAGEIGPAHAILLARLQPADQGRVMDDVFRHDDHVSVGRLRSYIERDILLDLKKAPFDTADAQLVPAAGACLTCPKRTGCSPALFEDIKSGDTCTDPACYATKRHAGLEQKLAALEAKHGKGNVATIVTDWTSGNEEKALTSQWPSVQFRSEVKVAGKDKCDHTRIALIVQGDRGEGATGDTRQVCTAPKTCKVHRERFDSNRGITVDKTQREKDRKHRHEQKVWSVAKRAIFDAVMPKVKAIGLEDLRMLAEAAFDRASFDGQKQLVPIVGWDYAAWQKNRSNYPEKQIAVMKEPELRRLLFAASLAGEFSIPSWSWGGKGKAEKLEAMARRWKVDAAGIEKKIRAQMPLPAAKKAPAKARPKTPAKAKKAKKR